MSEIPTTSKHSQHTIHRVKQNKPAVALREWAVVLTSSLTVAFTAWGLAGVVSWSLHTMLLGAVITFIIAIVPLPQKFNGPGREHGNAQNINGLLKFPVFWFGLAFLIYISIQGLNPSWYQMKEGDAWWMERTMR